MYKMLNSYLSMSSLTYRNENIILNVNLPEGLDGVSYKSLLISEARKLSLNRPDETIHVALSGGLDSEAVALSFLEAGINIKAAIISFHSGLNFHDISHAINFCNTHQIPYSIFELDILSFLESGTHLKYADEFQCTSPQIAAHIWLRKQVKAPLVFSGQAFRIQFRPEFLKLLKQNQNKFLYEFKNHITLIEPPTRNEFLYSKTDDALNSYSILNFLSYTSEIRAASILSEDPFRRQSSAQKFCSDFPVSQFAENQYFQEKFISGRTKFNFFKNAGFAVLEKPMKFTGFERVHFYYSLKNQDEKNKFLSSCSNNPSMKEDTDYRNQLTGLLVFNEKFRAPMQKIIHNHYDLSLDFSNDFLEHIRFKLLSDWSRSMKDLISIL